MSRSLSSLAFPFALFACLQNLPAHPAQDLDGDGSIDLRDAQVFAARLQSGTLPYRAELDCNRNGKLDLQDALRFGQWVNGLWRSDTAGFPPLLFGDPADRALFSEYVKLKPKKAALTLQALRTAYPDRSVNTDLAYTSAQVEFLGLVDTAFRKLNGAGGQEYFDRVLRRGMAVYTRHPFRNFHSALDFVHTEDLPLLFTSDIMLHTLYRSYDNILIALEENFLIPGLDSVLASAQGHLDRKYRDQDYVMQVRAYLDAARKLLAGTWTEANLSGGQHPFGRRIAVDWSQFKPRGHYTRSPRLERYFRAMMWLSRVDCGLLIAAPQPGDDPPDVVLRMKKSALVLWDAVVNSGAYPRWLEIDAALAFMVGKSDGLSMNGMGQLVQDLGSPSIPAFVGKFDEARFDKAVFAGDYGMQTILSEINRPGSEQELRIFGFLPQRFVLDSYTFSELVNARPDSPLMPSSLDIAFMLGDNSALIDHPNPQPGILAGQREIYDRLSKAAWKENLYGCWLDFLRQLNGAEDNPKAAPVFRTISWRKKMRNTQLTSWAHLRHNTILYAKQSYTGGITCSHPRAYVEPYPAFFRAVTEYANRGATLFRSRDGQVAAYFARLAEISGKLREVAERTAAGLDPTDAQVAWLKDCISADHKTALDSYGGMRGYKLYNGWFFDLVYEARPERPFRESDGREASYVTVADVHSKPGDDRDPRNLVLHAATGYVNLAVVAVRMEKCISLFVGPVGTYYDVVTGEDKPIGSPLTRLTDDEWEIMLLRENPKVMPPAWTQDFNAP